MGALVWGKDSILCPAGLWGRPTEKPSRDSSWQECRQPKLDAQDIQGASCSFGWSFSALPSLPPTHSLPHLLLPLGFFHTCAFLPSSSLPFVLHLCSFSFPFLSIWLITYFWLITCCQKKKKYHRTTSSVFFFITCSLHLCIIFLAFPCVCLVWVIGIMAHGSTIALCMYSVLHNEA